MGAGDIIFLIRPLSEKGMGETSLFGPTSREKGAPFVLRELVGI